MRLIKILGLAAVVAMVTTAFLGASTASANPTKIVLCKKAELECEKANQFPNPTEIHLETLKAEPPILLSSLGTVECENSLARVTLLNVLSELIEGHLLELSFTGNCHLNSSECTITVLEVGGLSFTKIGPLEASMKAVPLKETLKNTKVKVVCGPLNCTFSASESTLLKVQSDELGHLLALAVKTPLKGSGFLCPSTAEWDATYHAVNLDKELTLQLGLWVES